MLSRLNPKQFILYVDVAIEVHPHIPLSCYPPCFFPIDIKFLYIQPCNPPRFIFSVQSMGTVLDTQFYMEEIARAMNSRVVEFSIYTDRPILALKSKF